MKRYFYYVIIFTVFSILLITPIPNQAKLSGEVGIVRTFTSLEKFTRPVDFKTAHDKSDKIFVVEQQGVIYVFDNEPNVSDRTTFLDIRDKVSTSNNEEGLLGLDFHPDFKTNGQFYVYYSAADPRRSILASYTVNESNKNVADKTSEEILLEIPQPYGNHNGGSLSFGPDGYLYLSLGDGGSGGDPDGNGQDRTTLLGSILRIDVHSTTEEESYGIPSDNPFVNNSQGYREEIYAYGLRNVWRFSFDTDPTSNISTLWAADVGQNAYEEINLIESGKNYGWNIMEGKHCYDAAECNQTGLTLPIYEYDHSIGRSITGGYVYRGSSLSQLYGNYIYADFVTGRIWALEYKAPNIIFNQELANTNAAISSFGVDQDQEIYFLTFNGDIYTFKDDSSLVPGEELQKTSSFLLLTGIASLIAITVHKREK